MTIEDLLKTKVKTKNSVTGENMEFSPDFRISVQDTDADVGGKKGVRVIMHAMGHNSDTLDLLISGNNTYKIY